MWALRKKSKPLPANDSFISRIFGRILDAFQAGLLTKRFSRRLLSFAIARCSRRFRTGILRAKGKQEHIRQYAPANLIFAKLK